MRATGSKRRWWTKVDQGGPRPGLVHLGPRGPGPGIYSTWSTLWTRDPGRHPNPSALGPPSVQTGSDPRRTAEIFFCDEKRKTESRFFLCDVHQQRRQSGAGAASVGFLPWSPYQESRSSAVRRLWRRCPLRPTRSEAASRSQDAPVGSQDLPADNSRVKANQGPCRACRSRRPRGLVAGADASACLEDRRGGGVPSSAPSVAAGVLRRQPMHL